ncbi:SDR family oxidoreductase [Fodinicola feengrottensis]|uniref:SDR family oxidoreductase n=1 Tax=Fodinicola feengrottensis TaxID=435914 RepID=UPI00244350BA
MPSTVSAAYPFSVSSSAAAARIACRTASLRGRPGCRSPVIPPLYKTLGLAIAGLITRRGVLEWKFCHAGSHHGWYVRNRPRQRGKKLTAAGADVIVTGRDPDRLAAVRDRVAAAEQVDGASESEVASFFDRAGVIDHLVLAFSPGAVGMGNLSDTRVADIRLAFEGKLFGYLSAIQRAKVTGSITMVSAVSARAAMPGTVALAAVNGAIERIVPPLAAELAPVRVNAVSPGVIDTPWWAFVPDDQRQVRLASYTERIPAGRAGEARRSPTPCII